MNRLFMTFVSDCIVYYSKNNVPEITHKVCTKLYSAVYTFNMIG